MTWAEEARKLARGAERAQAAGDTVAAMALAVAASQCLMVARLLRPQGEERTDG